MINLLIVAVFAVGATSHATPIEAQYNPKDFFINERIVGGGNAKITEYPWSVALTDSFSRFLRYLVCGGSIISKKHVLTAAHCVEAVLSWPDNELRESLRGTVGSNVWSTSKNTLQFKSFRIHPDWNPFTIKNDISILYVVDRIVLSQEVAIIPLSFEWVESGQNASVAGWGRTEAWGSLPETLQHLEVTIINIDECVRIMQDFPLVMPPVDRLLEICTYHSVGKGMCNGDSGSALVLGSTGEQVGIVSWGMPCAQGMPDVFASLYSHQKFIEECMSL